MRHTHTLIAGVLLAGTASLAFARGPVPMAQSLKSHADLLSAGLGLDGLRNPAPPAGETSPELLRKRALWANWRGIADLAPGGGYGDWYGRLAPVPGREYSALLRIKGNAQPHRVMVQIPDNYDLGKRCLVVTASSGSRGIYGAIALAGAWGLNHGCAVAYTDKGAGTGFLAAEGEGYNVDGHLSRDGTPKEFQYPAGAKGIAVKHAHSGDNPEADWGRYVQQASEYALATLDSRFPQAAPFTAKNTRTLAVGVSNGAGAVLRAAELPGNWLDGVVAVSPNIHAPGARPLYDYSTEAALLMPCALNAADFDTVAYARPGGAKSPAGALRCASLKADGMLAADTPQAQAEEAWTALQAAGWHREAVAAGALSTAFDLWRAVSVTYASAYLRRGPDDMPCGYRFDTLDAAGKPRTASEAERALWWSDSTGIPPSVGVGIVDGQAAGSDAAFAGLKCLRTLWTDNDAHGQVLRRSVAATQAKLPAKGLPVLVIHGADDGLVPEAFSGGAYAAWAAKSRPSVRYWQVKHAQHFDAFLGQPVLAMQYVPLMPYAYRGLDAVWAAIAESKPLPDSRTITPSPRKAGADGLQPLTAESLGL